MPDPNGPLPNELRTGDDYSDISASKFNNLVAAVKSLRGANPTNPKKTGQADGQYRALVTGYNGTICYKGTVIDGAGYVIKTNEILWCWKYPQNDQDIKYYIPYIIPNTANNSVPVEQWIWKDTTGVWQEGWIISFPFTLTCIAAGLLGPSGPCAPGQSGPSGPSGPLKKVPPVIVPPPIGGGGDSPQNLGSPLRGNCCGR